MLPLAHNIQLILYVVKLNLSQIFTNNLQLLHLFKQVCVPQDRTLTAATATEEWFPVPEFFASNELINFLLDFPLTGGHFSSCWGTLGRVQLGTVLEGSAGTEGVIGDGLYTFVL